MSRDTIVIFARQLCVPLLLLTCVSLMPAIPAHGATGMGVYKKNNTAKIQSDLSQAQSKLDAAKQKQTQSADTLKKAQADLSKADGDIGTAQIEAANAQKEQTTLINKLKAESEQSKEMIAAHTAVEQAQAELTAAELKATEPLKSNAQFTAVVAEADKAKAALETLQKTNSSAEDLAAGSGRAAKANAMVGRMRDEALNAEPDYKAAREKLAADKPADPKLTAAQQNLIAAQAAADTARLKVMETLAKDPAYAAAKTEADAAKQQVADSSRSAAATPEQIAAAAQRLASAQKKLTELEANALASDAEFTAAKSKLEAAQKNLKDLQSPAEAAAAPVSAGVQDAKQQMIDAEKARSAALAEMNKSKTAFATANANATKLQAEIKKLEMQLKTLKDDSWRYDPVTGRRIY
jgi:chromosome segregation ATPase